jgi:hypothetical protein
MTDNFKKYVDMKTSGASPEEVFREAVNDKVDLITRIRMIRSVFCLSALGAKEVFVRVETESQSLDQHQEKIANEIIQRGSILKGL